MIVTVVAAATTLVVTVTGAEKSPAANVAVAGSWASDGLLLVRLTSAPPAWRRGL